MLDHPLRNSSVVQILLPVAPPQFNIIHLYSILCCTCSILEAPPIHKSDGQTSSASIFDHVDRMSRAPEAGKRLPSKIQLIAMQPIPAAPLQNPLLPERVAETNKINKEVRDSPVFPRKWNGI